MVHVCRSGRGFALRTSTGRLDTLATNGEPSGELPAGPVPTIPAQGDTLYVPTYIVVLVGSNESMVPGDHRIYDQMLTLNKFFSASNATLKHVPSRGKFSYRNVIGNPAIQFDLMGIETRKISYKVDGVNAVFKNEKQVSNALNVFIAHIETDEGVLGETKIGGTCAVVDYTTVGGENAPAISAMYNMGITLVHEIGHAFSLRHNFDEPCHVFWSDVPPQRYPNLRATLTTVNGEPDAKNDNRAFDCTPPAEELSMSKPYSCSSDPCNDPGEMVMNAMEYGEDRDIVMFSEQQARQMYDHVLRTGLGRTKSSPVIVVKSVDRIIPMPLWLFCVSLASALIGAMIVWCIVIACTN